MPDLPHSTDMWSVLETTLVRQALSGMDNPNIRAARLESALVRLTLDADDTGADKSAF